MKTVAGLPYPRLSCSRFSFEAEVSSASSACPQPESIPLLTDEDLFRSVGVRVAFTGREGGVSSGPYASLNLGSHVDDDLGCVLENRSRLMSALGASSSQLIVPNQVHGTRIVSVAQPQLAASVQDDASDGADGVEVLCDDVAALLCFADCMPVIVVAPSGAFAVVHAGWRGVYGHIAVSALRSLCDATACQPDECNIYLGPCIQAECFEVSEELADKFSKEFGESCIYSYRHVDLVEAMRLDLERAGANPRRIASAGVCTVCNCGEYFSYRATDGVCGRHGAFAVRVSR